YSLPDDEIITFDKSEEPETWEWKKNLKDPSICSPSRGESLIEAFVESIYQEILAWREDLGF
ncbi:MAG: hypothetical protein ACTSUE_17095, partial [Promethearchaeota archaeon]